jgi:hypothetical protein
LQRTGRKNAQMGCQVRQIGMKFAAKILHELASGTLEVRHQRITRLLHTGLQNYTTAGKAGHRKKSRNATLIYNHPVGA